MKEILEPGDEVVRGPDWIWGNQDGGKGSIGVVLERDDLKWYKVTWPSEPGNAYEYLPGKRQIILAPIIKKIEEPIEVTVKIKKMNNKEFKNALKGLK